MICPRRQPRLCPITPSKLRPAARRVCARLLALAPALAPIPSWPLAPPPRDVRCSESLRSGKASRRCGRDEGREARVPGRLPPPPPPRWRGRQRGHRLSSLYLEIIVAGPATMVKCWPLTRSRHFGAPRVVGPTAATWTVRHGPSRMRVRATLLAAGPSW